MRVTLAAALLALCACNRYPQNDFECRIEASRASTTRGVNEASEACYERFKDESDRSKK